MANRKPAPADRLYMGYVEIGEGGPGLVRYVDPPRHMRRALNPRNNIRNHSPDGFQWGYGGSGPAQLALALLCDALGDDERAQQHYQRFKFNVIARLGGTWRMTASSIVEEINRYETEEANG